MEKTIITVIVLLVVIFGIYYVVSNNTLSTVTSVSTSTDNGGYGPAGTGSQTTITSTTTTITTSTSAPATSTPKTATISINNFSFVPATLTIKKGTKVTWTNSDSASHNVTSVSNGLLISSILAPGQSFSYTFTSVGTTNYYCSIHPNMKGSVVVTE